MSISLKDTGRTFGIKGASKLPRKLAALGIRAITVDPVTASDSRPTYFVLLNNGAVHKAVHDGVEYVTVAVTRESFNAVLSSATA